MPIITTHCMLHVRCKHTCYIVSDFPRQVPICWHTKMVVMHRSVENYIFHHVMKMLYTHKLASDQNVAVFGALL